MDRSGSPKNCYQSKEDATRRAEIIEQESGTSLSVYQCPDDETIWHLTKSRQFPKQQYNYDYEEEDVWYPEEFLEY
jgi:hypothetical protein